MSTAARVPRGLVRPQVRLFWGDRPFFDTTQRSAHATLNSSQARPCESLFGYCGNPTPTTQKHKVTVLSDGLGIESDGVGGWEESVSVWRVVVDKVAAGGW